MVLADENVLPALSAHFFFQLLEAVIHDGAEAVVVAVELEFKRHPFLSNRNTVAVFHQYLGKLSFSLTSRLFRSLIVGWILRYVLLAFFSFLLFISLARSAPLATLSLTLYVVLMGDGLGGE